MDNLNILPSQRQDNSHLPHPSRFLKKPVAASSLISGEADYIYNYSNSSTSVPVNSLDTTFTDSKNLNRKHRLSNKNRAKQILIGHFRKLGESDLADKFALCHSRFAIVTDGKSIRRKIPTFNCSHRLCVHCSYRRAVRIKKRYLASTLAFTKTSGLDKREPVMLTLTQKVKSEALSDARKRLAESIKKLLRRKLFSEFFAGGLYSIEATITESGDWHVHAHLLAFRRHFLKPEQLQQLKTEWSQVSKDARNLNLDYRKNQTAEQVLDEVFKYIFKPADLERATTNHIKQLLKLKGERMISTFGEFQKFYRENHKSLEIVDDSESETKDLRAGDICDCGCGKELYEIHVSVDELIGILEKDKPIPPPMRFDAYLVSSWLSNGIPQH
jgi:plasmid rolling circle replication initiator protein Rep